MASYIQINIGWGNERPVAGRHQAITWINFDLSLMWNLWYSPESSFTSAQATILYNEFSVYTFKHIATYHNIKKVNTVSYMPTIPHNQHILVKHICSVRVNFM